MKKQLLLLTALLCLVPASYVHAQDGVQASVEPREIQVGALYNGTSLHVTGRIPADSDVVLRFLGAACNLHLKEKGKVCGIMWMNLDSLVFNGVPSVCIVNAAGIPHSPDMKTADDKDGIADPLSLEALKKGVTIENEGAEDENAFEELIKLKKQEGLYREVTGNVFYGETSGGLKQFRADIPVPSRLSPGDYVVEASAIRNGAVIARSEQPVTVKLVGVPAFLAGLAFGHSVLYGVLATVIALLSGLVIGVVFQSKGAH